MTKVDEHITYQAREWAVDYKPICDELTPQEYGEYGFIRGYQQALKDMKPSKNELQLSDLKGFSGETILACVSSKDVHKDLMVLTTIHDSGDITNTYRVREFIGDLEYKTPSLIEAISIYNNLDS